MARDQEHISVGSEWVELTNDDVTVISFQALQGPVFIRRGNENPPSTTAFGWMFLTGYGRQGVALDQIAVGAGQRVWARTSNLSSALVMVDHD